MEIPGLLWPTKWPIEKEKEFWERMKVCKGKRTDGRDGLCIDPHRQNLGCVGCPIGDGGLYEPEAIDDAH